MDTSRLIFNFIKATSGIFQKKRCRRKDFTSLILYDGSFFLNSIIVLNCGSRNISFAFSVIVLSNSVFLDNEDDVTKSEAKTNGYYK